MSGKQIGGDHKVARCEAFGELVVDGQQHVARIVRPRPVAPELREIVCCAQPPRQGADLQGGRHRLGRGLPPPRPAGPRRPGWRPGCADSSGAHHRSFWAYARSSAVRIVVSASPRPPAMGERVCQDTEVVGHPRQVIDIAELLDGPLEAVNRSGRSVALRVRQRSAIEEGGRTPDGMPCRMTCSASMATYRPHSW